MFENISVTQSFKNSITTALAQGRLSHAVILESADISMALAAAKQIACYLQCTGENKPCGICSSCTKNASGSHPDVYVLEKKPDANMIKVDEIRELKKRAMVLPNDSDKSVFIIHCAEDMNPQAQNALLKIFEEPAKHVCFILTCRTKSPLLDTIISRATCYYIGSEESQKTEDSKSDELARELLEIYVSSNELSFLKKTALFQKDKQLFRQTLSSMIPIVRDALILKGGGKDLISNQRELANKIQNVLTLSKIINLTQQLQLMSEQAENSANHNLMITRFCSVLYSIKTNK